MRFSILSAALFSAGLASAAVPIDGFYTSLFGGYTYVPDNIRGYYLNNFINNTSYNNGYNFGARLGFQSNPLRYEAEYTYVHASVRFAHFNFLDARRVDGSTEANFAMANLYYDAPEMLPAINPFLGVGIGYAYLHDSLIHFEPYVTFINFNQSRSAFAYQGTLGLTYNFAEFYALNIAYRYTSTTTGNNFGIRYQAHMASAGAVYHFDYGNFT